MIRVIKHAYFNPKNAYSIIPKVIKGRHEQGYEQTIPTPVTRRT